MDADRARTEGRTVFLYRHDISAVRATGWSGPVTDTAEVIEAIEGKGWRLDQLACDGQQSTNGAVLLLFRRAAR